MHALWASRGADGLAAGCFERGSQTNCHAGVPWCSDCARCLAVARQRVADIGGTLLEVQVCNLRDKRLLVTDI